MPSARRFQWRALARRERYWTISLSLLLCAFLGLSWAVMAGQTPALDAGILTSLRRSDDLSTPRGPAWITSAMLDVTALGSTAVLGLVVLAAAGFLALQTRYRAAIFLLLTTGAGDLANRALKEVFMRPRPTVVPHLRDVVSPSFPSGHAADSAIVYLTLSALLIWPAGSRVSKAYSMGVAVLMTGLVGVSRVYLGVHYPTDVIGGWMFGVLWASSCWIVFQPFETHAGARSMNLGGSRVSSLDNVKEVLSPADREPPK